MVERGEVEPRGAAATTRPKKHMRQSRRPPARAVATGLAKKTCGGGAYEVTPRRPIRPQHRLVGRGRVEWEEPGGESRLNFISSVGVQRPSLPSFPPFFPTPTSLFSVRRHSSIQNRREIDSRAVLNLEARTVRFTQFTAILTRRRGRPITPSCSRQ